MEATLFYLDMDVVVAEVIIVVQEEMTNETLKDKTEATKTKVVITIKVNKTRIIVRRITRLDEPQTG